MTSRFDLIIDNCCFAIFLRTTSGQSQWTAEA